MMKIDWPIDICDERLRLLRRLAAQNEHTLDMEHCELCCSIVQFTGRRLVYERKVIRDRKRTKP